MVDLSVLQKYRCNFSKLAAYGFALSGDAWVYTKPLDGGKLLCCVTVQPDGAVQFAVDDASSGEPLDLFYIKSATGKFINQINAACQELLLDIRERCFVKQVFRSAQTQAVIDYVATKYGDALEFLWAKFDDNAIWRRADNRKWYALLQVVPRTKLGLDGAERVEILDIRADAATMALVDHRRYFPGYHMNKQHWLTVCLDDSVPTATICDLIDQSYQLAK